MRFGWPFSRPGPEPEPPPPLRSVVRTATTPDEAAALLSEVTEMRVWDWIWIEHPPEGEFGADSAIALDGSTDLDYYTLVRVIFRGARASSLQPYFSHAEFVPATGTEIDFLPEAWDIPPGALVVRVTWEEGSPLAETGFLVADSMEVHLPPEGADKVPPDYVPTRPEHFGLALMNRMKM